MSWSVNAHGRPEEVMAALKEQFKAPLADKPAGLSDDSERETVGLVQQTIDQCVSTFGIDKVVAVSAHGHMGYRDWITKTDAYQEVSISIKPTN